MDWVGEKARFSHDWLMNTFYQAVAGLMNACQGKVLIHDINGSAHLLIRDWQKNMPVAKRLIQTCEAAMSPQVLFSQMPLALLGSEDKASLSIIVHEAWLVRYDIKQRLKDAETCVDKLQQAIDALDSFLAKAEWNGNSLVECATHLLAIQRACSALKVSFSKLPTCIMV